MPCFSSATSGEGAGVVDEVENLKSLLGDVRKEAREKKEKRKQKKKKKKKKRESKAKREKKLLKQAKQFLKDHT